MMQRDFAVGSFDEDDLLDELNDLDEELAMEEMSGKEHGAKLPSAPEEAKTEEDALNDLMN